MRGACKLALAGWLVASVALPGLARADAIGIWATVEGKSHVQIEPCGDRLCGTIIRLKEPNDEDGNPKRDKDNQDESLRDRPIIGLKLLNGFKPDGDSKTAWDDGTIYNPEDGKTYSSEMALEGDNIMMVKGCVWIFCKKQTWTRVQ